MRLIDADELKKKLQARRNNSEEDFDSGFDTGIGVAMNLIHNAPTFEFDNRENLKMYNHKLLRTLEERFDKLQAYLFRSFDGGDLYSFIASVMYDKDYADCCEIKDGKPNPQGKELRERAKQFILPVVAECGGILDSEEED